MGNYPLKLVSDIKSILRNNIIQIKLMQIFARLLAVATYDQLGALNRQY